MTREGYEKHKKLIEKWSKGANIKVYDENKERWVCVEYPTWDYHEEYRIKQRKAYFNECMLNATEYLVNFDGKIETIDVNSIDSQEAERIMPWLFTDKKMAEAYAVLPQLIRLMMEYNSDWQPDWKDEEIKYCIGICNDKWELNSSSSQHLLAFKTAEIRDDFFEDHKDLLEIVKPLL